MPSSQGLEAAVDRIAGQTGFSGVVRVDVDGRVRLARAFGLAHRGHGIANSVDSQLAIASGGKGLTALAVASLIEEGRLDLGTSARSVLGADLPLIADEVTVEHLLSHRSGIGDYLDENDEDDGDDGGDGGDGYDVTDHVLSVPVHELATTEGFLGVLDGHPPKFSPGERFSYCNGGYVVLALIAERAGGMPFADLVRQRVCGPAGMADTEFLRSDEPSARAALGYLGFEGLRTNLLHLPVRGNGDGGAYSTLADISSLWSAFLGGRIVSSELVAEMVRPRSEVPAASKRYGLGFWLHASGPAVMLEGMDAGVSFRSVHDPFRSTGHTVISNTTNGAWPLARYLDEVLLA